MIGWLIAAVIVSLILSMKLGVFLKWDGKDIGVKLRVGFLHLSLQSKPSEKKVSAEGKKKATTASKKKPVVKKWLKALLANWQEVLALVKKVLRAPKLDFLLLRIYVGNQDPEICAMEYGRICGLLGAVLPAVQQVFSVGKQDIDVQCCFDRDQTDVLLEVETTIRVYEAITLLVAGLLLLIKLYRHTKLSEKAV